MNSVLVHAAVCSDKGRVRSNNEDNYYLNGIYMNRDQANKSGLLLLGKSIQGVIESESRDLCQVYAVCDGMGGADSGEEASYCAVSELARYHHGKYEMYVANELTNIIRNISGEINRQATQRGDKSGTTLAMVSIKGDRVCIANVGDSRVYVFSENRLKQVSLDHSEIQRMITMGMVTAEEARTHPRRHVINQYMGMPIEIQVSPKITKDVPLNIGDMYILCSDGLTDMVEDHAIEQIAKEGGSVKEIATRLVSTALNNGGRDNVTVMVLQAVKKSKVEEQPRINAKAALVQKILTGVQILAGSALVVSLIDLIYLFINS